VHKKISTLCLFIVAFSLALNGCSSMSAQARRERAYRHYVQKQIRHRQRDIARAQKAANRELKKKMKLVQPSEPQVTTSVGSTPESSSSWSEPMSEPVADPITVSASTPVTKEISEPSQP
jgi:hypothetical protein